MSKYINSFILYVFIIYYILNVFSQPIYLIKFINSFIQKNYKHHSNKSEFLARLSTI